MAEDVKSKPTGAWWQVPSGTLANTAVGAIAGGLGAGAIVASLPVILPFALLGGAAGYLLTNEMPND